MEVYSKNSKRGFTLIELLVVIAIIGILAGIILVNFGSVTEEAKIARAQADLDQLYTALLMFDLRTGLWPGGKTPEMNECGTGNNELCPDGCSDRLSDFLNEAQDDPWGNEYFFDTDYYVGVECLVALGSYGPNGVGNNLYDGDDIIHIVPSQ